MRNNIATGKTHYPLKRGERLISLDSNYTKKYNYHNEFGEHTHHLLNGAKFLPQGSSLWQIPQRIVAKLSYFIMILLPVFSLANPLEPKNFSAPTLQELQQGNSENIQDLKNNEFYLNLNPKEIDSIQKKDDEIRKAFDRFSQKEINYKPVIRPIASMDSISLHPYFTFTLLLPQGSVIHYVDSSTPMAVLKFENNAVLIRPNADFKVANITILYKLKETNHILNILATFYQKNNELDKLNLVYSYSNLKKLDDLEVIQAYIRENQGLPKQKYSYIQIDDISYRIVEDENYGNIFIAGKKYRVDNNTIYK